MNEVEIYARDVIKGAIIAPSLVVKSCERFISLCDREDVSYRPDIANKKVTFIETHVYQWEGIWEGLPFNLELWQKFIIHYIFGLFNKDGRRLVTRAYIQIPRKNGKTAFIAALTNDHLFADPVKTPQILVGANNEDQAKICTTSTANMIEASPTLKKYKEAKVVNIFSYKRSASKIVHDKRNGMVLAMSRDMKSKDGFNPSLGIVDEYHEADDSRLLDVIRSGQGSRPEPLLIVITTAGFKKQGPCYSILRRVSIDILNGLKEDDSHFSMIYEPDEDDDWESIETWKKVNPNYGVSVFPHYLESRYKEAKNEGAHKEVDFKTKNLNLWSNSSVVWMTDELWMKNDATPIVKEKRWYAGLDMAYKRDFTALVLVSTADEEGYHDVLPFFWIPEDTVELKSEKDHSSLPDWIRDGLVMTTSGNVTDHTQITEFIINLRTTHEIIQLTADPAYAISTMNALNNQGLETLGLPQTPARLTPPTTMLYELVMKKKIRHGGNPVLRWMLSNCLLHNYANDLIKIRKEGDINRIDGIDALIDALAPFDIPILPPPEHIAELW